jgi:hypothetical protein
MAAVLEESPEDPQEDPSEDPQKDPSKAVESQSGLKPIRRLTSDDRLAKIIPSTLARTEFMYYSRFVRDFVRSDYNFAAAKMAVARNGKLRAIENEFRVADAWLGKTITAISKRHQRVMPVSAEKIELEIKHALSGRLVRLLEQYDRLFIGTMRCQMALTVTSRERQSILDAAEARINQIPFLCIPDANQFASDGTHVPGSGIES